MVSREHSPLEIKVTEAHQCSISLRLEILRNLPFLQSLSPSDLKWVNSLIVEKDFHTGDFICYSGDVGDKLFIIADGKVRLMQHSLTGRDILLDLLNPGEFFGAFSSLGNETYSESAQAHTSCCVLVITNAEIHKILMRFPDVAIRFIEIMAVRLRQANERVHQLGALSVEDRIASILVMLADKFGEQKGPELLLQVPLFREDIAAMAGATVESASRVMSRFQKAGLIRSGRGWVAVRDREGLKAKAQNELH
jgi:CRP-like cAMP-binding protein